MKLYELTGNFAELFDRFDEIDNYTPDTDALGRYIDDSGNVIEDIDAYREAYRTAWFETLSALEEEFDIKAENIACYIKNLSAEIKAMKEEENALRRRRQAFENSVERLKGYLLGSMNAIGKAKIEMPRARLSVRRNAESLVVDDELSFIGWAQQNNDNFLKYAMPEIRKTEVKKAAQAGKELPFVHLARTESLIIK